MGREEIGLNRSQGHCSDIPITPLALVLAISLNLSLKCPDQLLLCGCGDITTESVLAVGLILTGTSSLSLAEQSPHPPS